MTVPPTPFVQTSKPITGALAIQAILEMVSRAQTSMNVKLRLITVVRILNARIPRVVLIVSVVQVLVTMAAYARM